MQQIILQRLQQLANPEDAKKALRYVKSGPGEYSEGDVFLGIRNPVLHQLVKEFKQINMLDLMALLSNDFHEARHLALLLMVYQFERGDSVKKTSIYQAYLANTAFINNWDLVDCSCYKIVGPYLIDKDRTVLCQLVESESLWERRIAMVSTMHFIRHSQFDDVIQLSQRLLTDKHDLMHKAVGWMLREAGKRDEQVLLDFLNRHYQIMPRTALRYAIEKLPEPLRQDYLKGKV